jgi:hypothetical protein
MNIFFILSNKINQRYYSTSTVVIEPNTRTPCRCLLNTVLSPILMPARQNLDMDTRCSSNLSHAHIFKPVRSAILLHQPRLSISESCRHATFTFRAIGTVEIGNVLVADVSEPVHRITSASALSGVTVDSGVGTHTNGSYSHPQTTPMQYYAPAHPPTSHRRTPPHDLND